MNQTKRGEKDREQEKEVMQGEPIANRQAGQAEAQPASVTRDKSVEPANDRQRDGRGMEED